MREGISITALLARFTSSTARTSFRSSGLIGCYFSYKVTCTQPRSFGGSGESCAYRYNDIAGSHKIVVYNDMFV